MSWPSFPLTQLPYGPAANCLVAHEAGYAVTKQMPHASRGSLASPSNAGSRPAVNRKQAVLEAGSQDAQLRDHTSRMQLVTYWTETKKALKRPSAKYSSLICTTHDGFSRLQVSFQLCREGLSSLLLHWWHCTAVNLEVCSLFWNYILCIISYLKSTFWIEKSSTSVTDSTEPRLVHSALALQCQLTLWRSPSSKDGYCLLKTRSPTHCSQHVSNAVFSSWSSNSALKKFISSSVFLLY